MSHYVRPGLGDVGSYQSAGMPFAHMANGNFTINFKYVTRAIVVTCSAQDVGNTIILGEGMTPVHIPQGSTRFEVKSTKVVVGRSSGTISVVAELTGIEAANMPDVVNPVDLATVT